MNHSYQPPKKGQNPEKKIQAQGMSQKKDKFIFFKSLFLLREVFKWYLDKTIVNCANSALKTVLNFEQCRHYL